MNSSTRPSPRSVRSSFPSTNTGATGASKVPGRLIPMSACFDSPGAVDDAAHHRDPEVLDARVGLAPFGHPVLQVRLDLEGHLLEERRGRPAAPGTRGDLRQERAEPERLEDLLGNLDLALARRAGLGRERHADRVADPLVEQDRQPGRRGDDPLVPHPRLGQPEMERVVAAGGEQAVDVDEVTHARDLGADDDPVMARARSARPAPPSGGPTRASPRSSRRARRAVRPPWRWRP